MFGTGKHAQAAMKELSDGGITYLEAMEMISRYDRIHLRWQLSILIGSILIAAAILFASPKIKTFDECLLHYTKQGMSEDAAINIRWGCQGKYDE